MYLTNLAVKGLITRWRELLPREKLYCEPISVVSIDILLPVDKSTKIALSGQETVAGRLKEAKNTLTEEGDKKTNTKKYQHTIEQAVVLSFEILAERKAGLVSATQHMT